VPQLTAPPARSSTPPAVAPASYGRCSPAPAKKGFQSRAVHERLSLCLSCKACKTECPVSVDIAAYKSEFLAQRYKGRPHPLHHYIFGFADQLARWGSLTPALTNAILTGPLSPDTLYQAHRWRSALTRQLPTPDPRKLPKGKSLKPLLQRVRRVVLLGLTLGAWKTNMNHAANPRRLPNGPHARPVFQG